MGHSPVSYLFAPLTSHPRSCTWWRTSSWHGLWHPQSRRPSCACTNPSPRRCPSHSLCTVSSITSVFSANVKNLFLSRQHRASLRSCPHTQTSLSTSVCSPRHDSDSLADSHTLTLLATLAIVLALDVPAFALALSFALALALLVAAVSASLACLSPVVTHSVESSTCHPPSELFHMKPVGPPSSSW